MWGYGSEWGMMGGWGWGSMFVHGFFWLLVLVLIVAGIILLVRSAFRTSDDQRRSEPRSPGLDALEERYARGEINRDEYLQKKNDIVG